MVWRIHFSADDLDRIQLRPTLGPLAEAVLAVSVLRDPEQPGTLLSQWRGQVQDRVSPRLRPLAALIPPGCKGVDLPTLTGETTTIAQGVRVLLDVPREHLLVEMAYTDRFNRLPPAAWALAEPPRQPAPAVSRQREHVRAAVGEEEVRHAPARTLGQPSIRRDDRRDNGLRVRRSRL